MAEGQAFYTPSFASGQRRSAARIEMISIQLRMQSLLEPDSDASPSYRQYLQARLDELGAILSEPRPMY
jgi:hypothetical protein